MSLSPSADDDHYDPIDDTNTADAAERGQQDPPAESTGGLDNVAAGQDDVAGYGEVVEPEEEGEGNNNKKKSVQPKQPAAAGGGRQVSSVVLPSSKRKNFRPSMAEVEVAELNNNEEEGGDKNKRKKRLPVFQGGTPLFPIISSEDISVGASALSNSARTGSDLQHKPPRTTTTAAVKRVPHLSVGDKHKNDRYGDYYETHKVVLLAAADSGGMIGSDSGMELELEIPSLSECRSMLRNDEAEKYKKEAQQGGCCGWRPYTYRAINIALDMLASLYIYLVNSIRRVETFSVILNACLASYFFCRNADRFAAKLDFSFLAFSVVFPLTFLLQSTFARREVALQRLADFKTALLAGALLTLTVDWDVKLESGVTTGGRLALPENFAARVATDYRDLVQLAYEYLSMPTVSHARNLVFPRKRLATMRVHALQNDIVKRFNDAMFGLYARVNEMKAYGFPSGEASRLHQYHQYIQQRFELLKGIKYYRTPQATRAFGRVYIYVLPWMTGPYFAWAFELTEGNYAYCLSLAAFTYVVLLGILNTQAALEDPFVDDDHVSRTPGIDSVKLDFELAGVLQAIDQYYAQSELHRLWAVGPRDGREEE